MNIRGALSTTMLFVLPGAIAPAFAQEHGQEKQPAAHQQEAKPAAHQQEAKPAQHQEQAKPAKQQAARTEQTKPAQQQQRAARTQQAKPAQQQERGQQAQAGPRQAAGGHGSIPEARYNASFGSSHTFHVSSSQFANGSGRFNYGGYWFNAANPWPVGWLYTDAVYVAYLNGGYFLCNPIHPGVYISVNIG
jgi:outer membrane biosynthesis protein TonB